MRLIKSERTIINQKIEEIDQTENHARHLLEGRYEIVRGKWNRKKAKKINSEIR